ncbi:MAG: hypothetical protein K9G24_02955 [Candidatus Nanopelagicales bacterium]|nr:hypothetical protein [Candidatus Nanopelagicales bacterium]MCF8536893.1 hypothetical protein [Candidatus Nanopelagicales bacterium]MCF8542023.1 hypothetical protein [Candidatus Nanopelagicales bacterium]MCF8556711.1 hypothetical protein [Candidatus Nanopelagicales bacterium]
MLPLERLREAWSRIGGSHAITFPAWLLTFPLALLPSTAAVEAISDSSNVVGDAAAWLLIKVVGQLVLGVVLWLAWLTYLAPRGRPSRPLAAILTFALAGATRGLIVLIGEDQQGLPADDWWGRIATVALGSTAVLIMAALVVDGFRRHRDVQHWLTDELAREEALRRETLSAIDSYRRDLLTGVQRTVETELAGITTDARTTTDTNTSERLSRLAASIVRPLGRELMTPGPDIHLINRTFSGGILGTSTRGLWSAVRGRPFTPAVSAFVIFAFIVPFARNQVGMVEALIAGTVMACSSWVILDLASRLYSPNRWSGHPRLAATVIVSVWLTAALAASLVATALITSRGPEQVAAATGFESPLRSALFLLVWIVGPPVALSVSRQWSEADAQLQSTLASVSHMTSELNLRAWFERRSLGVRIHGAVQSELVAAALRIVNDPACNEEEVLRELGERVRLRLHDTSPLDWRASLEKISEVWRFSIVLGMDVTDDAATALDLDGSLALAAVEIVREGIVNAVRAGAADRVDVSIWVQGLDLVIVVADDGDGLMGQGPAGAGTRLLDDACLEWTRHDSGAGTVLRAVLAATGGPGNDDVD